MTDVMVNMDGCNQTKWLALTSPGQAHVEAVVRQQRIITGVIINGPRYWVTQSNTPCCGNTKNPLTLPTETYGDLDFIKGATVAVSQQKSAYTVSEVTRSLTFKWCGNCEVYLLTDPSGYLYIMQSFSQRVDPNLSAADLPTLGSRLQLPSGWSYHATTLVTDFVYTGVIASVLQDDFQSSYTKMYRRSSCLHVLHE